MYETRDDILSREKALRQEPVEVAGIAEYFHQVGVKIGNHVFSGLDGVNPADLHRSDLLHNIYLGLFKHMIEWVEGFLQMEKQGQACNNAWKESTPYPRLRVRKKAYREVTYWQGNEMPHFGRCVRAVLGSAFRNPNSFVSLFEGGKLC